MEPVKKAARTEGATTAANTVNYEKGPFSVLELALKTGKQIAVTLRNNKIIFATLRAYDKHFNMLLTDVTEITKTKRGDAEDAQVRKLKTVMLRGDSVIYVVRIDG